MMIPRVLRSVRASEVEVIEARCRTTGRARPATAIAAGLLALLGLASAEPAHAEPLATPPASASAAPADARRVVVETPPEMYATPPSVNAEVSQTLYLERCKGDCIIQRGLNDARTDQSTIPMQQMSTVREFKGVLGEEGDLADEDWNELVQCMREVYSPFAVTVTDVKPPAGMPHHKAIVAGTSDDLALGNDNILGIAPLASDCSAIDNVISFSFANAHPKNPLNPRDFILNLCWTVAQESAHAFGLDHQYSFTSGNRSACNDPMTYRNDCGGQKFFRNDLALCGENTSRPCRCGPNQNSHVKLDAVFGAGTPITGAPTVALVTPGASGGMLDRAVTVRAGSKRGITKVELWFNGFKWAEAAGLRFERDTGQPNPGDYSIVVPAGLPDSIVDVKAIAYDDLGGVTESAVVTVTKGAACQSATSCAVGQRCDQGKCFWDPPAGELGDDCSYPQFCKSGLCSEGGQQICTQACMGFVEGSCPSGLDCVATIDTAAFCLRPEVGGCCSVDRSGRGWLAHAVLAALVLGFVIRRRRR